MTKVFSHMTMSLDGFIAQPDDQVGELFEWYAAGDVSVPTPNKDITFKLDKASAGMVGVNVGVPVPREPFSFGGWNESRFGVGDITGKSSIEFWTKLKKSTTKWNPEAGINWMT